MKNIYRRGWLIMCCVCAVSLSGCGIGDIIGILKAGGINAGDSPSIITAMEYGSLEGVKEAVEAGGDVNATILTASESIIPQRVSLYEYATMTTLPPYSDIAGYLVENGANLNCLDRMGESPLMNVAAQDNVEACKKYISYGADINFATKDGQTALDIAIIAGARHTAEYLMSLGMEPTEATLNTMLEGASPKEIGYKRYGSVRFLVEELAKRDIPTGLDPAVEAAILGKSDVLIEACEKGGISPDTINWMGYNAAAFCSPDALAACISGGFSIYQEDEQDRPLVIAARYGNLENVQWLIENYQHNDGANIGYAFDAAVVNGWVETVRYFLSIGIQMQFWDSLTPLSNVASKGDLEMVKTLLGSGQNFPHDILWTATYRAATSTQYDTLEYLLANVDLSKDELQQIWTVSRRSLAQLQLCVKYGADPKDPEMLYNAAEYGRYDVAEYVIEMGTDPNSVLYEPALMRAVKNGYFDIVQLLVRHGADVDWQDSEGSILSWAAVTSYNITKLLLDAGADVELTAQNGNTPLMDAAAYNQVSCAKLLLEAGADPSIKNNAGKTAKDIAKERSHKALVKLLD